jgi:prepilin-type N-terminal cleavage/methylation domain-containing protein
MKNRIHGLRGFTLVEVMISVSIFAVIMVAVNLVYLAGTRTYQQSTTMAQGRMITQKVVFEMEKDLVDCRVRDGSNLLDQLHFDKPTPRIRSGGNPDTDLRYFDASTLLPFWGDGETETDGSAELHVDNYIRYEFIQAAVLTEAADRRDYNRDGDMTDTFQRGRIVRSVRRPVDPSSPALEPSNVIGTRSRRGSPGSPGRSRASP